MQSMSMKHKKLPPLLGPYPAGTLGINNSSNPAYATLINGPPWGNPFFFLLPELEQDTQWKWMYNQAGDAAQFLTTPGYQPYAFTEAGGQVNDSLNYTVRFFLCPADPSAPNDGLGSLQLGTVIDSNDALCSYAVNALVFAKYITAPGPNQGKPVTLVNGTSA